jgi:hypothetical protein
MDDKAKNELNMIRDIASGVNGRWMLIKSFLLQLTILAISIFLLTTPFTFYLNYRDSEFRGTYDYSIFPFIIYIVIGGVILLFSWLIVALITKFRPGFWLKLIPKSIQDRSVDTIGYRISQRSQLNHKDLPEIDKFIVITSIDDRIGRLRTRNSIIIGAISLSLGAAVLVVIYAGQLTSYDVSAISETDRLKSELRSASNTLALLDHYQALLSQPQIDKTTDPKGAELRNNDYLDATRSLSSAGLALPKDAAAADAMVAVEQKWIESLNTLYKESWDEELKSYANDKSSNQWRYLIATAITRIGVILIIVFLVQIFLGLYRYNTRLLTFYSSIMDTLILADSKREPIENINKIVGVPNIDFGKEPRHPLEDIIRAAGGYLKSPAQDSAKGGKP